MTPDMNTVVRDFHYVHKKGSYPNFDVIEVKSVEEEGVFALFNTTFIPGFHICIQHCHKELGAFEVSSTTIFQARNLLAELEWDIQFYDAVITTMRPTLFVLQFLTQHKASDILIREEQKERIRDFEMKTPKP